MAHSSKPTPHTSADQAKAAARPAADMNAQSVTAQLRQKPVKRILFVCLGNICRSAAAEEVMRSCAITAGRGREFILDSAGIIAYHEGEPADPRMRDHAARRGYRITHLSRPVRHSDFTDFDLIVAMDSANVKSLMAIAPDREARCKIVMMHTFCRTIRTDYVPDPYYGGPDGFELVLDMLEDACAGLLDRL